MTTTSPILRTLDQEITRLRQEIAVRQLEIYRIEETRLTLMSVDERRAAMATEAPAMAAGRLLNGTSLDERPALVVRHVRETPPEGKEAPAATKPKKRKSQVRYDPERSPLRAKLWAWFLSNPTTAVSSTEIIAKLGLQSEADSVYRALTAMRGQKDLSKDANGRYALSAAAAKAAARAKAAAAPVLGDGPRASPRRNAISMRERLRTFLTPRTEAIPTRDIITGMRIEKGSLDDKLLGQSLSAMKARGELLAIGDKPPYRYRLAR